MTMQQLIDTSQEFDTHKTDFGPAPARHFSFHPDTAQVVTPPTMMGSSLLEPTDWALGQVCQKLGPAAFPGTSKVLPKDYLAACPPAMRAEQLNLWLTKTNGTNWFVRGYDDNARAVLSDRYSVVGVTEALTWIQDALESKGVEGVSIHNPVVTPDVLHIRVLFRDVETPKGLYRIGGYFTTGETGNRKLGAYPMVQRTSCVNSISFPVNAWSWESRHIGHTAVLKRMFVTAIYQVLKGAVDALDKVLEAQETQLPNFTEYVDGLVKGKGWTSETRDYILLGSEHSETLWGVAQGISYASQRVIDEDERADMEMYAGALLIGRR